LNIPEAIAAAAKTAERRTENFIFDGWLVVKVVGIAAPGRLKYDLLWWWGFYIFGEIEVSLYKERYFNGDNVIIIPR
jgi:hypothetical protein